MTDDTTWREQIAPIVQKLDLTVAFGGTTEFNVQGSKALAALMKEMANRIDSEIEGRKTGLSGMTVIAKGMTLFGANLNDMPKPHLLLVIELLLLNSSPKEHAKRIAIVHEEVLRITRAMCN